MPGNDNVTPTGETSTPIRQRVFGWRSAIAAAEDLGAVEGCNAATVKLVAMMLSTYMSERGDSCFPSLARLAKDCSLGKSTIARSIARLEALGFLIVERGGGGRGNPTHYLAEVPGGKVPPGGPFPGPVDNPVKVPPQPERSHQRPIKVPPVGTEEPLTSSEKKPAVHPQPDPTQRPHLPRFVLDETPVDPAANLTRLADVRRQVIADPKTRTS